MMEIANGRNTNNRHGGAASTHSNVVLYRVQLVAVCLGALMLGVLYPMIPKQARKEHGNVILRHSIPYNGSTPLPSKPDKKQSSNPRFAWLMSFPNSGTTYTLNLVSSTSNMTMASNYKAGRVNNVIPNGPYWLQPNAINPMEAAILTKTHCGGYCHRCRRPQEWLETPHSFLTDCATVKTGDATVVNVYDYPTLVDRTIHLVRDPMDNMVARFHYGAHKAAKENETELVKRYTPNVDGFRRFCQDHTFAAQEHDTPRVDQDVLQMIEHVPCHLDLFRYVQWHNLAFIVSEELLKVPSHVLYYEDYNTDLNGTLVSMLDFLGLPYVGSIPYFQVGKSYRDEYFTPEERLALRNATMKLASLSTWESLQRYFE